MDTKPDADEFFKELRSLPESEKALLHLNLSIMATDTRFENSMDLLHEAIVRHLDGARIRPQGVGICEFLFQTARSIVSTEWKLKGRHPSDSIEQMRDDPAMSKAFQRYQSRESAPSAEDTAIEAQDRRLVMRMLSDLSPDFHSDTLGRNALQGWATGMTPQEIQKEFHAGEKEVKAALARVAWRIKKWKADHRELISAYERKEPT